MTYIPGSGTASPLTTKGDLYGYSTVDARIPVGTNGQYLGADSTNALGVSYQTIPTVGGVATVLNVNTTQVGNVGGGTDDLITFSVPGGTLANNGEYLHGVMAGSFAGNINSKTLTAVFGSTTFFTSGALSVVSAADWSLEFWIYRITATTQLIIAMYTSSFGTLSGDAIVTAASETLSGALTLKCTGAGTSNNDIVQKVLSVEKWVFASSANNSLPKIAVLQSATMTITAGGGTKQISGVTNQYIGITRPSTHANGDAFSLAFFIRDGTYTFHALYYKSSDAPKVDISVDGVSIVTGLDLYNGVNLLNVESTAGSIVISPTSDGMHTLLVTTNGKNASSSDYYTNFTMFWFD
jgi:hypothetical protein